MDTWITRVLGMQLVAELVVKALYDNLNKGKLNLEYRFPHGNLLKESDNRLEEDATLFDSM